MQLDHQRMIIFAEPQETSANGRGMLEVKGFAQRYSCVSSYRRRPAALGAGLEVQPFETRRSLSRLLERFSPSFMENEAERFMTLAARREACLQGSDFQRSKETRDFENVVIVLRRVEPAQHVDSLLLK